MFEGDTSLPSLRQSDVAGLGNTVSAARGQVRSHIMGSWWDDGTARPGILDRPQPFSWEAELQRGRERRLA
jgi:hypothetical protein